MKDEKIMKGNLNVPAAKLPKIKEKEDFRSSMHWRVFRIMSEFIEGFQFIADYRKSVTIFGSAVLTEDNKWYQEARKLGQLLAKDKFAVITGGGPGIMEAGNRGTFEKGGSSVGVNIQLPREQRINPYVNRAHGFHYFFSRKLMLTYSAQAYVYFPGGYGTLDEFFEIVTLIQTKKIFEKIPVILVGRDFWNPLVKWMEGYLLGDFKTISPEDLKIFTVVDSAEEAMRIIQKSKKRDEFGD